MTDTKPHRVREDWRRQGASLPHAAVISVLGLPVRFEADRAEVIDVALDAFGQGRRFAEAPGVPSSDSVTIRFFEHSGDEGREEHPPITYYRPDRERLVITTPGSVGVGDTRRREALAWVTQALVRDREQFRYSFLEALTLALLTGLDRHPVHAAAVARNGAALLLAGPSGIGKSTLAYACARDGLAVLADDVVYLESGLEPGDSLRVWGLPRYIHLPPDAPSLFQELGHQEPRILANGKSKIVIRTGVEGDPAVSSADRVGLCVLSRGSTAALSRLGTDRALAALTDDLDQGFDVFHDTTEGAVRRLVEAGKAWLLELGSGPREALPYLYEMFDELDRVPVEVD